MNFGETVALIKAIGGSSGGGGGGGSSSGVLVVTSSYDEETGDIETLDKTWAEIKSAVEAGMFVIKKDGNLPAIQFSYINTLTGFANPVNYYTVSFSSIIKVEDTISTDVSDYSTTSESGYPSHDWSGS